MKELCLCVDAWFYVPNGPSRQEISQPKVHGPGLVNLGSAHFVSPSARSPAQPSSAQVWLVVVPVLELEVVGWWGPSNAQPRCRQPSTFFSPPSPSPPPGESRLDSSRLAIEHPSSPARRGVGNSLDAVVADRPRRVPQLHDERRAS